MKTKRLSFLDVLEKVGNVLPHPAILFIVLIFILALASAVANALGLYVIDPRDENKRIVIANLLSMDGLVHIATSLVKNFSNFPPLGSVLIAMLGVGIAEASGFLSAAIRALVLNAPKKLATLVVVFAGIMSNLASDVGYVVLIPLAGMIFYSLGRHPLAGIAAAFAGVSGGYSANLLIGTLDPILSGITQQAARMIDPTYVVGVEANWYFMFVSTFLIVILGYFVTEKIVEPRLGSYQQEGIREEKKVLDSVEKRGLFYAFLSLMVFIGIVLALIVPSSSSFRNQATGSLIGSPFFTGIIFFVFLSFAIPGIVYGYVLQVFNRSEDVIEAMAKGMRSMGMYLVIIFFAAQFIALFSWSNFGPFLAIKGASFLKWLNMDSGVLLICFVVMSAAINLMIASSSAQWALLAPIFVPMLMLLGYSPEVVQAAYRIGDSVTNIVTPLLAYLPIIVVEAMKYQKDIKMGTMISMMFPYSFVFLVGWCVLLYLWVFVFGLPVGPGAETFYKGGF
ncbi:AbgT family transporter [Helicobacter kayseriensis]|uniref:AbgT family transporter n=1 Tax=Helicobacter kayseriensis TaxID=2905877 RepID=UPI001E5A7636|nr:AbgT family transporter [Helicobacter kayseriensis]MCE3047291.1 AbgT family transporter [Helicobacter kayseriensis]MCE3048662.1 AbgT family transporter [Helicobacter kayseriensis]